MKEIGSEDAGRRERRKIGCREEGEREEDARREGGRKVGCKGHRERGRMLGGREEGR